MWRAALVLLVALVAGCSAGPAARSTPSPASLPSPSPVTVLSPSPSGSPPPPAVDYGPVPAGVQVFYALDPGNHAWLTAIDWTGKPVGTLKLAAPLRVDGAIVLTAEAGRVVPAPNGDRLLLGDHFVGRSGSDVGTFQPPSKSFSWADDSRHICGISEVRVDTGVQHVLWTWVGGKFTDVREVGPATGDQTGFTAFCSYRSNLAAVEQSDSIGLPQAVWYVRLSDAAIVGQRTYPREYLSGLTFAPDLSVMAESRYWPPPEPGLQAAPYTLVRRISDGAVLARRAESVGPITDGGRYFVVIVPNGGPIGIYSTATNAAVWGGPKLLGGPFGDFRPRVGGEDMLVSGYPDQSGCSGCEQVVIVHGGGQAVTVPGLYVVL